jgi:hypothetical protein
MSMQIQPSRFKTQTGAQAMSVESQGRKIRHAMLVAP